MRRKRGRGRGGKEEEEEEEEKRKSWSIKDGANRSPIFQIDPIMKSYEGEVKWEAGK